MKPRTILVVVALLLAACGVYAAQVDHERKPNIFKRAFDRIKQAGDTVKNKLQIGKLAECKARIQGKNGNKFCMPACLKDNIEDFPELGPLENVVPECDGRTPCMPDYVDTAPIKDLKFSKCKDRCPGKQQAPAICLPHHLKGTSVEGDLQDWPLCPLCVPPCITDAIRATHTHVPEFVKFKLCPEPEQCADEKAGFCKPVNHRFAVVDVPEASLIKGCPPCVKSCRPEEIKSIPPGLIDWQVCERKLCVGGKVPQERACLPAEYHFLDLPASLKKLPVCEPCDKPCVPSTAEADNRFPGDFMFPLCASDENDAADQAAAAGAQELQAAAADAQVQADAAAATAAAPENGEAQQQEEGEEGEEGDEAEGPEGEDGHEEDEEEQGAPAAGATNSTGAPGGKAYKVTVKTVLTPADEEAKEQEEEEEEAGNDGDKAELTDKNGEVEEKKEEEQAAVTKENKAEQKLAEARTEAQKEEKDAQDLAKNTLQEAKANAETLAKLEKNPSLAPVPATKFFVPEITGGPLPIKEPVGAPATVIVVKDHVFDEPLVKHPF